MKLIVVGAGGASRALLRRIGEVWEVTVIDTDQGLLDQITGVRSVTTVLGDGKQREVLDGAGLADAIAVVAADPDDDANLAICRAGYDSVATFQCIQGTEGMQGACQLAESVLLLAQSIAQAVLQPDP